MTARFTAADLRALARHEEHVNGADHMLRLFCPHGVSVTITVHPNGTLYLIRGRPTPETIVEGVGTTFYAALAALAAKT